ncbi:MAG: Ig-like domain-containing protein [Terriglobales bacterium]
MSKNKRKLQLLAAFTTLFLLAFAVGCKGFFVNPTLTSLAIGPQTFTLTEGQSQQMAATGTYDDGTTKDLTGKVSWSSSDMTCATVTSPGGLVAAPTSVTTVCTATISGSFGAVPATSATATVSPGAPSKIVLTANPTNPQANSTITFSAIATFPGGMQDITTLVTWNNSDPTDLTLTDGDTTGTLDSTVTAGTQITVSATFDGVVSNNVVLTVATTP